MYILKTSSPCLRLWWIWNIHSDPVPRNRSHFLTSPCPLTTPSPSLGPTPSLLWPLLPFLLVQPENSGEPQSENSRKPCSDAIRCYATRKWDTYFGRPVFSNISITYSVSRLKILSTRDKNEIQYSVLFRQFDSITLQNISDATKSFH